MLKILLTALTFSITLEEYRRGEKNHGLAFLTNCFCEEQPNTPSKPDSCGLVVLSVTNILFVSKTAQILMRMANMRDKGSRMLSSRDII